MVTTNAWMLRPAVVGAACLLFVAAARAELQCEATVDRTSVEQGSHVVLTVSVSGGFRRVPTMPAPRIEGVSVSSGGTSQSFSFVNGASQAVVQAIYYLQVERQEDFTIPALTISAGKESCTTAPISIDVTDPGAGVGTDQTGNRTARPGGQAATPGRAEAPAASGPAAGRPGDEVYITVAADRREAWVGEQVILVFRYHRRVNPWDNPSYQAPSSEGFWRVDLPPERNFREVVGGQTYQVTEIRYALFATRSGTLEIGPARLSFSGDPLSRLMGRSRGRSTLETAPFSLRIKELPFPRPSGFSGVVASDVRLTATVDRDTVPRGEPVELALQMTADGFLKSFTGLTVSMPPTTRVHDATDDLREDVTGPRYRATLKQEKVLVPTEVGILTVVPIRLEYFDPARGRYATAAASPGMVVVTPSDLPVLGGEPSGFGREEISRLGTDLAFVHAVTGTLARRGRPLPEMPGWWCAAVLPIILLAGWRLRLRHDAYERGDPLATRRRRAHAAARRILARGARARDAEASLAAVAAAINGYVADRTGRSAAGLTAAEVRAYGASRGDAEAGDRLVAILDACAGARYGGGLGADFAALAAETERLLTRLERGDGPVNGAAARANGSLTGLMLAVAMLMAGAGPLHAQGTAAPAPAGDPARLVAEGNDAYTRGDIEAARRGYEGALALGIDDPRVHYNLANVHAREGRLGRAVAGYLRALRQDPRDRDAAANLAWARSHTRDLELGARRLPPVIDQLDRAAGLLSLDEWAVVTLVLIWVLAAAVALAWWRGGFEEQLRRALLVGAAALAVAALVTAQRWYVERVRDTAVVVVEEVEVRSGPAPSFPVVFRIHDGLILAVRGERGGWSRIGLGGDWVGWVPEGTLERVRRDQGR
jgi:hypothetical protein